MPAHHRDHPYLVQLAALYLSLLPVIAVFALLTAARFVEDRRRSRKPAFRRALVADARLVPADS